MNAATREFDIAICGQVEIGKIDRKERILVLDRRTQELKGFVFKSENQPGKMPRFLVVEAVSKVPRREDVAMPMEDSACITVFEDARPAVGESRGGEDVKFFLDSDDFVQTNPSVQEIILDVLSGSHK